MRFDCVEKGEDEASTSEADILLSVGIIANRTIEQNNKTGVCLVCGEKIPKERLEIFPGCNCCVPCQEKKDGGVDKGRRALYKSQRPFENTVPLSSIFATVKDGAVVEHEYEEGDKTESDSINKEDLSPGLRYALKSRHSDSHNAGDV